MPHIGTLAALLARSAANPLGRLTHVAAQCEAIGWNSAARMVQRAAIGEVVSGFGTDPSTHAELTALQGSLAGQFFSAKVATLALQYPRHSVVGVLPAAGVVAAETDEFLAAAPVLLSNGIVAITPSKVMALLCYSNEVVALRNFAALAQGELERAIGRGLDKVFASRLAPGSAGGFSASSSALADLRELVANVVSTNGQQLVFAGAIDVLQRLAFLAPGGVELFPLINAVGAGELKGAPILPSDQLSAGSLLAVDPTGLAATIESVTIEASPSASVQLDSLPDMPASLVSMFQSHSICLRASASFTCAQVRGENVSSQISNISWTTA